MDFTLLRPGKVWAALEGHPDRPGLRTVERWCAGAPVPQWAEDAITELLQIRKTPRPDWAEELVADVKTMGDTVDGIAAKLVTLERALEAIRAGLLQSTGDPQDDQSVAQSPRRRDR